MELGVGIPQIKGCCQWVLIPAMSITGIKRLRMSHKVTEIIELKCWSTKNVILSLKSEHSEELKHIQLQAENELRGAEAEGITANAVESFGNKPQEDQEVNSKKVVELDFLYPCEFVP
ncbi:hypothetical protein C1H46_043613 [Malus baccata]|uniref:Uncharacterized protein n=1 Tax=Malus baccata TaxID=106549 RepID=A0A540K9E8_MALBA|nr:hypothetical protein C1H46_043613 [Malus baccata]